MPKKILERIGAVKFGRFRLSSGRISNVYIDLRVLFSYPKEFKKIISKLQRIAKKQKFDYICGIPTGGLSIAAVLAFKLKKPFIYVRKEPKPYGTSKQVEGKFRKGARVLIVDDVATSGKNLKHAAEILKANGLNVEKALVVVDRKEGAAEALNKIGVKLLSLTDIK